MQKIPARKLSKRNSDFVMIDSADILKIVRLKDQEFIIYTKDEQYVFHFAFDSIEEMLFEDGFRMLDHSNIVNMNHAASYDPKKGIVYLGHPEQQGTLTASAARIHKEHIQNVIQMLQTAKANEINDFLQPPFESQPPECIQDGDTLFFRSYATIHAVNERKLAEQKVKYMAYHDALTSLPNRLSFYERLNDLLKQVNGDTVSGILFMDLDRFKVINDTLGHDVGDLLLKHVAKQLTSLIDSGDMVARFGGDEFIILVNQRQSAEDIIAIANQIPELLSLPFMYRQHKLFTSVSIGISLFPEHGATPEVLIKQADTAMYQAKDRGGDTYELYNPDMDYRSIDKLYMESALRDAVMGKHLSVHYQPFIDLSTDRVFGMEALIRWNHPELGWVSPGEFIPMAEETGLIAGVGQFVMKTACQQTKTWIDQGLPPLVVSVNISAHQFHQTGFVKFVTDTLTETGLPAECLCLEITENIAMKNIDYVMETMNALMQLGIKISIDDFGTGYSSFSYLKRFHVHTLKIDKSFISDVTEDEDNAAIVTALIAMSQQLKIKTLAEGVETIEQLNFLRQKGCDEIQGFIYSKALPAKEFEQLMVANLTLDDVMSQKC